MHTSEAHMQTEDNKAMGRERLCQAGNRTAIAIRMQLRKEMCNTQNHKNRVVSLELLNQWLWKVSPPCSESRGKFRVGVLRQNFLDSRFDFNCLMAHRVLAAPIVIDFVVALRLSLSLCTIIFAYYFQCFLAGSFIVREFQMVQCK